MLNYIHQHSDKLIEISKPIIMGLCSVTFVTIANIEIYLKFAILILTAAYTIWKWRKESQEYKKNETKVN